jgi:VanZ family protein
MLVFIRRWGPALLVMAVIFASSSQPKAVIPDFGEADLTVKKAGHVLVFALLAASWMHGMAWRRAATWRDAAVAVLLATLYGVTDEWHQSFVPGRNATPVDVLIDGLGALLGAGLYLAVDQARRPRGRSEGAPS